MGDQAARQSEKTLFQKLAGREARGAARAASLLGVPRDPASRQVLAPVSPKLRLPPPLHHSFLYGKFKVSSLRNVAKTAPYGHNGYFKTLKEIVHFHNTRDVKKEKWPKPEYGATVNTDELGNLGLTYGEEDDIVAFLKTLSDYYPFNQ